MEQDTPDRLTPSNIFWCGDDSQVVVGIGITQLLGSLLKRRAEPPHSFWISRCIVYGFDFVYIRMF